MQFIPLFVASGKSGKSQADTDEGRITLKRDLSQVNSIRTQGTVSAELEGEEHHTVTVKRKGDEYVGAWKHDGSSVTLPPQVACQAYETVRHLAGARLSEEQIDDVLDLVSDPLNISITDNTCKKLAPAR